MDNNNNNFNFYDILKGFDTDKFINSIDNVKIPQYTMPELPVFNFKESPVGKHMEGEKLYWEKSLMILNEIQENTANLAMIVDLINKNNKNQDEIISILSEVLEIAKAKNKEEADNSYRKIMNKVITFTKDVEAIQKLSVFAGTMYTLVINNIDKVEQVGRVVKEVGDKFIK